MTVLIGQRNYEAEIYNKHTEVVKVSKHQGDCRLCYMTQITVNSAKFTTALNATKTAHCSSHLLQKNLDAILKKKVDHFLEDDHLTTHRLHTLQALDIMFKNYIHKYLVYLLLVKILLQPNFSSANTTVFVITSA